jgi:hypothetical protein
MTKPDPQPNEESPDMDAESIVTQDPEQPKQPLIRFRAHLLDNRVLSELEAPSVINLPMDQVVCLEVFAYAHNVSAPPMRICADPNKGERIYRFSRPHIKLAISGEADGPNVVVEVCGLKRIKEDGTEEIMSRLYWHPRLGLILSGSEEITF